MDARRKLEWFLAMQKNEDSEKITLDQETYIESVLGKLSMQDSNPSRTPAENNLKLVKATEVEQLVDETLYRSLVGSLLYIAKQTKPDIVWIVDVLTIHGKTSELPAGWLPNVCSAIYKPQSHSNYCTQETVTTI